MLWGRKPRMELGVARAPDGLRLYAIGDVHGMDAMLGEAHATIADDLEAHPVADYRIIHLGDYVDRGDDSAAVLERLIRASKADDRIINLMGNHDELVLEFLSDPLASGQDWLRNGGTTTLRDYGIFVTSGLEDADLPALSEALGIALPAHHRAFLEALPRSAHFGDFFFCHAGVRPGTALDRQDPQDLIWIRQPFLTSDADFGAVVIHGHTPVHAPDIRPNRIGIDTGAVFGRTLTTIAIEGADYRFL